MRILFLSPFVWDSAYRGRYFHLLGRLSARGHHVTVLEPRLSDAPVARSDAGLRFARPQRPVDAWGGAAEAIAALTPDLVIAASPPVSPVTPQIPAGRGSVAPRLHFDFSDEDYLKRVEGVLGPAGFLGRTLARKSLTSLARRADLLTAASEALRRELPRGALLIANPAGTRWGQAPVSGRTPALSGSPRGGRAVRTRTLMVAVLGCPDAEALTGLAAVAAAHRELSFAVQDDATKSAGPAAEGRLPARLARADVVVLVPATVAPEEALLAALTAGCPVLAQAVLKPALAPTAAKAELASSDLAYYGSYEDLGERLVRFSLTADPSHARTLEAKAERLRWSEAAAAFERAVVDLGGGGQEGAARR